VLPSAFLEKMKTFLGDEFIAFEAAFRQTRVNSLRLNPLKLGFLDLEPYFPSLEPVPWCPTGFYVPFEARAGSHVLHALGAYYIQEASAMAVAEILAPQPGERVLDLCAAPGGKSTHLASLMHSKAYWSATKLWHLEPEFSMKTSSGWAYLGWS
jgi:16S rRNA C967 or C1407 C5-methylase (RsmB/RsmF family)